MNIKMRTVVIDDYDNIYELWNSTESKRALNPVDDSRDCFASKIIRRSN
ncbi:MAG: hypothetical protein Q4D76_14935 [Oscillospiraceae bacterium]|nr:hypothetical protein [Oscillospiraceae bacterium]